MDEKKRAKRGGSKRRKLTKKERRRQESIIRLSAVMISLLVVAAVVMLVAPKRSHTVIVNHPTLPKDVEIAAPPLEPQNALEEGVQIVRINTTQAADSETPTPEPTEAPTDAPTEAPTVEATVEAVTAAPQMATAEPVFTMDAVVDTELDDFEYLPVFKQADIYDHKIAITVDDCYQIENLQTICSIANKYNGRLTLFPIGENLSKQGMEETLRTCAFDLGFEIENHTWSHSRIFRLSEYDMAKEIWDQSQELNKTLGVNYKQHFFRLMGGDGSSDQRTHSYLKQLGYYGIASWSISGSNAELQQLKNFLKPGAIYLFHTTDRDTGILKEFIPYVASMGYEMVTLNELLGFEENEVTPYAPQTMPIPQAYKEDYRTHKVGDYAYNILLMQDKLRDLGLLVMDGPSTGYYGEQTAAAIKKYQESQGLAATGVADSETQRRLLTT